MQKVTAFLEKYVEWLAVGLGIAFLLFMVWTYVLSDVGSMPLGSTGIRVTPGDVDETIANGAAKDLQNAIQTPTVVKFDSVDYTASLQNMLNLTGLTVHPMATAWDWDPLKLGPASGPGPNNQNNQNALNPQVVQKLPEVPSAAPLLIATGQSTVVDAANSRKDINWAEVLFTINAVELQKQWKACFGPDPKAPANTPWKLAGPDGNTVFLSATLYRSYKLPNGTWSPDVEVPRLWNNQLAPYPPHDAVAQDQFAQTIAGQQGDVIAPKFPDLAPAPFGTNFFASDKLIQTAMANKNATAGPGAAPAAPAVAPPAGQPAAAPDPEIKPNMINNTVAPAAVTGSFNPGEVPASAPDYLITMYDTTLKPNVTYKYHIIYKLKNPLFHLAPGRAASKILVDTFELFGKAGDYSADVMIASKTKFYAASAVLKQDHAMKFDVYTESGGQQSHNVFTALPGDPIGGVNPKDSVDYSTGFTYVDAETSGANVMVTYMDDDGTVTTKDANADINEAKKEHPPAAAAPAGAAPAAGAPPAAAPVVPPAPIVPGERDR